MKASRALMSRTALPLTALVVLPLAACSAGTTATQGVPAPAAGSPPAAAPGMVESPDPAVSPDPAENAGTGENPGMVAGPGLVETPDAVTSSVTPAGPGTASPAAAGACEYEPAGTPARPVDPPPPTDVPRTGEVAYTLTTNEGPVTIRMDRAAAPCTVYSFESLAAQDFYDNTQCHRLVDSGIFVLQCGDPTGGQGGGPGYRFADEVAPGTTYPGGTVAMANGGPGTNGSQFFLVYADSELAPNYTVFGRMDEESRGVVARIAVEGQDGSNADGSGRPNNEARIIDVTPAS